MPVVTSYGEAGSSMPRTRGVRSLVKHDAVVTSYYRDGAFVYTRVDDEHFVFNAHWEVYLELRRERPRRVIIFDTLRELRYKLFEERGVLA